MYAAKVCINTTVRAFESVVTYDVLEVQFTDMKQECQRLNTTRETMKSYKLHDCPRNSDIMHIYNNCHQNHF